MAFTDAQIRDMLAQIETLLRDPTAQVTMGRGVKRIEDASQPYVTFEPTQGKTLTIETHGGAREETEHRWPYARPVTRPPS